MKLSLTTNIICHFLLIFKRHFAALQHFFINCFSISFYKCPTINNAVFFSVANAQDMVKDNLLLLLVGLNIKIYKL